MFALGVGCASWAWGGWLWVLYVVSAGTTGYVACNSGRNLKLVIFIKYKIVSSKWNRLEVTHWKLHLFSPICLCTPMDNFDIFLIFFFPFSLFFPPVVFLQNLRGGHPLTEKWKGVTFPCSTTCNGSYKGCGVGTWGEFGVWKVRVCYTIIYSLKQQQQNWCRFVSFIVLLILLLDLIIIHTIDTSSKINKSLQPAMLLQDVLFLWLCYQINTK